MKSIFSRLIVVTLSVLFLSSCGGSNSGSSSSVLPSQGSVTKSSYSSGMTATEQVNSVLLITQGMFNVSPGSLFLSELTGYLANGYTAEQLAGALSGNPLFRSGALYPDSLSSTDFAAKMLNNLVGSTVNDSLKGLAVNEMVQRLSAGQSRGAVAWWVVSALYSVPETDASWGAAAAQLKNKIAASSYYSVTKGLASTDIATLQAVTAQVTNDPATLTAAKSLIDSQAGTAVNITVGNDVSGSSIPELLGVNAGPYPNGDPGNPDVTAQYKSVGVKMVRTHDLYGPLDMSLMYPDMSKNPALASSYSFTSGDTAYDTIISGGFEPYFRIGDSWNDVKTPANATERANWASAAAYIVGRYLGRGNFRYVEIGNEPDFEQFWPPPRTMQEFFDLYVRTAKAIKTAYPQLKVGGPGFTHNCFRTSSGQATLAAFLAYVKANGAPLDFLSWHLYSNDPNDFTTGAAYYRQQLDAYGFTSTELHNSEWNTDEKNDNPVDIRLGGKGSAIITGSWISLVKSGVKQSLFFRGNDTSMSLTTFYGLFYANGNYKRNAYAFSLWSRLAGYPVMQGLTSNAGGADISRLFQLAGRNSSGNRAILLANTSSSPLSVSLTGMNGSLKIRQVSNASESLQEWGLAATTLAVPAYSAILVTSDGL